MNSYGPKKNKASKAFKAAAGIVLGGALVFGGVKGCQASNKYEVSNGDRTGTVTKLSYKGLFHKSWEGEMATDSFSSAGEGRLSNTFAFTVKDIGLIDDLQEAQANGDRVVLHYSQKLTHNPWIQDSRYVVESVKIVPKQAGEPVKLPVPKP